MCFRADRRAAVSEAEAWTAMRRDRLTVCIWLVNGLATLGYALWLVQCGDDPLLHSRDGVLWLLPILPIAWVYLALLRRP